MYVTWTTTFFLTGSNNPLNSYVEGRRRNNYEEEEVMTLGYERQRQYKSHECLKKSQGFW